MFDLILLVAVTVFIFMRLFKALGDTDYDNNISAEEDKKAFWELKEKILKNVRENKDFDKQIDMHSALEAELSEKDREIFDEIRKYDADFTADKFIKGAKAAFEMIIGAYCEGDLSILKQLLADSIYKQFEQHLTKYKELSEKLEITIVSIRSCKIIEAHLKDDTVSIKIGIESEQIKQVKDMSSGTLISGNSAKIIVVKESWTFAKDIKSKTKTWRLVETANAD